MASTPPASGQPVGLLLARAELDHVARWASRGLVAVHALPLGRWTAVLAAEADSRAKPPYDDAAAALAGRPVGPRLRPAVGFFVVDGRAVLTVHPSRWRAASRWLVWQPGHGVVPTAGLPQARPGDLMAAAGAPTAAAPQVVGVLRERRGALVPWLLAVLSSLGLPGAELLGAQNAAAGSGLRLVEPLRASVTRFEALVSEEAAHRAELGERR